MKETKELCFVFTPDRKNSKVVIKDDIENEAWQTRREEVLLNRQEAFAKKQCLCCQGRLVSIGTSRANGKRTHHDWDSREFHKKCWKDIMQGIY
jgi:hypothetical protein